MAGEAADASGELVRAGGQGFEKVRKSCKISRVIDASKSR
jgi:hypothetical protein